METTVEKLFYVKPDANPDQIKIKLSGAKAVRVNEDGLLEAETDLGTVKFTKPVAYQEINGKRVEVECGYVISDCGIRETGDGEQGTGGRSLKSEARSRNTKARFSNSQSKIRNPKSEYGFKVAAYDRTKELVIDPLPASTFLGGSADDKAQSIDIDSEGNVFVADIPPSGYEHSGRIASLLHEIKNLSWQANLYQSAGNIAESLELLTQAEKQTSWLIAEINADWAGQAINYVSFPASPEAVSSAWTKAIKSAPVSEESRNNLPYVSGHLLSQIRYGIINAIDIDISALDSGDVNDIRTGYPTGVLLEYIRQCITAGEIEQARNLAQKAYLDISNIELTQLNSGSMFSTLEELGKILLEIALPKEATLVAKKIVSAVPTNFAALQMLGFACNAQGEFLAALKAFSAASLLVPYDLDLKRKAGICSGNV